MDKNYSAKLKEIEGKLFINGKLVDSKGGKKFEVFNPATEEVIGHAVAGTVEDVDEAVKAAKNAFDHGEWRKMSAWERAKIMNKFADLV